MREILSTKQNLCHLAPISQLLDTSSWKLAKHIRKCTEYISCTLIHNFKNYKTCLLTFIQTIKLYASLFLIVFFHLILLWNVFFLYDCELFVYKSYWLLRLSVNKQVLFGFLLGKRIVKCIVIVDFPLGHVNIHTCIWL